MELTTQAKNELLIGRSAAVRPLALLISVIREIGGTSNNSSRHMSEFKRLLQDDNYEDFRDAVVDEWIRIKYSTALGAAHLPDVKELKRRHDEQIKRRTEARESIKNLKMQIVGKALELVMPNGKALAQCTGGECLRFGGWLARVGEVVGPNRLVGDVLGEKDLVKMVQST